MADAEWRYEGAENGGRVLAMDARKTIIHEPPCSPFNEQAITDAMLIAAAPDMLAALQKAVVLLAGMCAHTPELKPHDAYEAVSAAIAKATGCSA